MCYSSPDNIIENVAAKLEPLTFRLVYFFPRIDTVSWIFLGIFIDETELICSWLNTFTSRRSNMGNANGRSRKTCWRYTSSMAKFSISTRCLTELKGFCLRKLTEATSLTSNCEMHRQIFFKDSLPLRFSAKKRRLILKFFENKKCKYIQKEN